MPVGKVSVTVVVTIELHTSALQTLIKYLRRPLAVNVPCATFVIERSKTALSVVGGVIVGPLLPPQVGHSFGFVTPTWLVPNGLGALGESVTSSTSIELPPDGMEFAFVQLTLGTAPVH